jgi:hypothetical protein
MMHPIFSMESFMQIISAAGMALGGILVWKVLTMEFGKPSSH